MTRLWEVDHPYYCSDSNYYASGTNQPFHTYGSWQEFYAEEGDSDLDMNLVFRWDWQRIEYLDDDSSVGRAAFDAKYDDNYRAYNLEIFWIGQRKGIYRGSTVAVCRADEPAVREWLAIRWQHMRLLWDPISAD